MNDRTEAWLARAADDLRFAELGLKEGFLAQVCFLAQQIVEKSLKGALVAFKRSYPKTHNLQELVALLPELKLDSYRESLSTLDGYYVPLRYPDAAPPFHRADSPNKQEATQALGVARKLFEVVSAKVMES